MESNNGETSFTYHSVEKKKKFDHEEEDISVVFGAHSSLQLPSLTNDTNTLSTIDLGLGS